MNAMQKYFITASFALLLVVSFSASAAGYSATFDPQSRTLSVLGSCSGREAIVLIKKTDGTIWGSSNPPCRDGEFAYRQRIEDASIDPQSLRIEVKQGYGEEGAAEKKALPALIAPTVLVPPSVGLPLMTEALDPASADVEAQSGFALDRMLESLFGIVRDAAEAVQELTSIVANSVRTTILAAVRIFTESLTVLPGGTITVPRGDGQIAGEGLIPAGAETAFIANTLVTERSKVFVVPNGVAPASLAVTEKIPGQGFRVTAPSVLGAALPFDWIIVQTMGDASSLPSASSFSSPLGNPTSSEDRPASELAPTSTEEVVPVVEPAPPEAVSPPPAESLSPQLESAPTVESSSTNI